VADPSGVLYAHTSALVKLAVEEPETQALRIELNRWDTVATSVITEIELARAVARARGRGTTALDDVAVWTIIAALLELELTPEIRRAAAALQPTSVRSLDAITSRPRHRGSRSRRPADL
jgi:predicted nucleic acid-binding protein